MAAPARAQAPAGRLRLHEGRIRLWLRNLHSSRGLGDSPLGLGLDAIFCGLLGRTGTALGLDQARQRLALGRFLDRGLLPGRRYVSCRGRRRLGGRRGRRRRGRCRLNGLNGRYGLHGRLGSSIGRLRSRLDARRGRDHLGGDGRRRRCRLRRGLLGRGRLGGRLAAPASRLALFLLGALLLLPGALSLIDRALALLLGAIALGGLCRPLLLIQPLPTRARGFAGRRGRGRGGHGRLLLRRGLSRRRRSLGGGLLHRGRGGRRCGGRRGLGWRLRRNLRGRRRRWRGAPAALRELLLLERLTGGLALLYGLLPLSLLSLSLLDLAAALLVPCLLALLALAERRHGGCRGRRGHRLLGSGGRRIRRWGHGLRLALLGRSRGARRRRSPGRRHGAALRRRGRGARLVRCLLPFRVAAATQPERWHRPNPRMSGANCQFERSAESERSA